MRPEREGLLWVESEGTCSTRIELRRRKVGGGADEEEDGEVMRRMRRVDTG